MEYPSRSGVDTLSGLQRLAFRSLSIPYFDENLGTSPNRSICQWAECSAPSLFQLKTRSTGVSLRCLSTGMEHREELCLSPILSDHENSCQVTRGGWQAHTDYPGLANKTLVASATWHVDSPPPVLFPQVPKHLTNPGGDLHPLVQNKTQFLAPRHVSNNQSQQEAYRTGLTNPFWYLGDQAQIQCTIQPGVNGMRSWRKEREVDPLCPNLGNITEFLSDSVQNGLQYRTINTYRSALSNVLPQWRAFLLGSIF